MNYIRRPDFFTWLELCYLAKSLGFPEKIFWRNTPQSHRNDGGLDSKYFMWLLNSNKACDADLHRTVNMYSAEYNRKNILKTIDALCNRQLSFDQVYISRLAYQLYEEDDLTGLNLNEDNVMKTIKLCGRVIAPLRLSHEVGVDDMTDGTMLTFSWAGPGTTPTKFLLLYYETVFHSIRIRNLRKARHREDRAVYYEFIDILLRCNLKEEVPQPRPIPFEVKKKGELYDVCDFDALLRTLDDRLSEQLQKRYSRAQMMALKRQLQSKLIFQKQQTLLIGSDERDEMINRENRDFGRLSEFLVKSESLLRQAKCGGTQYRNYPFLNDQIFSKIDPNEETVINPKKDLNNEDSRTLVEFNDHLVSRSATAQLHYVKAIKSRQEQISALNKESTLVERISSIMSPLRSQPNNKQPNQLITSQLESNTYHGKPHHPVPDVKQRAATTQPKARRVPQYFDPDERNKLKLHKDSIEWDMVSLNQRTQKLLDKMHSKYERDKFIRNVKATWRENTYQSGPKSQYRRHRESTENLAATILNDVNSRIKPETEPVYDDDIPTEVKIERGQLKRRPEYQQLFKRRVDDHTINIRMLKQRLL